MCAERKDLQHHKRPFAHRVPFINDLESAVRSLKPTALIGVSTQAGAFTPKARSAFTVLPFHRAKDSQLSSRCPLYSLHTRRFSQ